MRPGVLYFTIFTWTSVSGGRFTAPFLQQEALMTDAYIGMALGMQLGLIILLSSPAGFLADSLEKQYPHYGRAIVICMGILIGAVAQLLQAFVKFVWWNESSKPNIQSLYFWSFILRTMYSIGYAMVEPVLDGLTLSHLQKEGRDNSEYGKERVFGAVGWAFGNGIMGHTIDLWGFKAMYWCNAAASIVCFLSVWLFAFSEKHEMAAKIPYQHIAVEYCRSTSEFSSCTTKPVSSHEQSYKKTCRIHDCHQGAFTTENTPLLVNEIAYKKSNSMSCHKDNKRQTTKVCSLTDEESQKRGIHIKSLGYWQTELKPLLNVLFASLYGTGFLFAFTLLSAGGAVVENLVFLFYETMGSNFTVCGLSVLVTVVFELPIFVMAPFLLTWMGGPVRMLFWGTAAFIVRVTTYTLVPQGKFGWLLVIESLHGVSYAFYKTSGVEFMAKLATPGREATAQGILNGLRGLGAVMGLSVAGWAQEIFGPRIMYRSFGAVNLLGLLVLLITERGENTTGITSLAISN